MRCGLGARVEVCAALALVVLFTLGGCAVHAPMSETVLFHDYATEPAHDKTWGFGFAATNSPAPRAVVGIAQERFGATASRTDDFHLNPNGRSVGFYLGRYNEDGAFAFSATFGLPVFGLDGTFQLWRRNYVTAAISVPGQFQTYLQHRAFNSSSLGVAVGIGYRRDLYTFDLTSECYALCLSLGHVGVSSFGVRSFAIYRGWEDISSGGLKLGFHAGYAPLLNQPVFSLTLMVGHF